MTVRAVALQEAEHGGLTNASADVLVAKDAATAVLVHVASESTDEGLVNLDLAVHLVEAFRLHGEPDAVEHEPGGLLSDADRAVDFVGADAVLGVGDEPHGSEPLVERDGRVLKDGSDLGGELLLRVDGLALPNSASLEERNVDAAAGGTSYPRWASGTAPCSPGRCQGRRSIGLLQ